MNVVNARSRHFRNENSVRFPTVAAQAKDGLIACHNAHQRVGCRINPVVSARNLCVRIERCVSMVRTVIIVERVVEVCRKRSQIRCIERRHLNCAKDIRTNRKVIGMRIRIDIRSTLHIRLQSRKQMIRVTVPIRLCACVIGKTSIVIGVADGQRITHGLYVLKIVTALVVPLVTHPIDNAFAVRSVCPCETCRIVVDAVADVPCVNACIRKVGITAMQRRPCDFGKMRFVNGVQNKVERMLCALCNVNISACTERGQVIRSVDFRDKVRHAVRCAFVEFSRVPQRNEVGIGDGNLPFRCSP